jgi:hypothetical protein
MRLFQLACVAAGALSTVATLWIASPVGGAAAPSTASGPAEVVRYLVARHDALSAGSIWYEHYAVEAPDVIYRALRDQILKRQGEPERRAIIWQFLSDSRVVRKQGGIEGVYYKGGRARVTHMRMEEFAHEKERLQKMADAAHAHLLAPPDFFERIYDAKYPFVADLVDGARLHLRAGRFEGFPELMDVDRGLGPWEAYFARGANPGQTITSAVRGGYRVLRFASDNGPGGPASAEYEFDPALGYAPVRILGVARGENELEITYGYPTAARRLPATPEATCRARFRPSGSVEVHLWMINQWERTAGESDFKVDVPSDCIVLDERDGGRAVSRLPAGLHAVDVAGLSQALPDEGQRGSR